MLPLFLYLRLTENFATLGLLIVQDCAFDNNENGIFVPDYNPDGVSGGNNVDILVQNCVFSYKQPNGIEFFCYLYA